MGGKKKCEETLTSALPWPERYLYFCVTVVTVSYICYCVYRDSLRFDGVLHVYDFGPGWKWIGREQDISNYEWKVWYAMFYKIFPWYIGHFALGKIIELNFFKQKKITFLVFSVISLCKLIGWRPVCLFTVHATMLYLVSLLSYTPLVWIVSLAQLSTLNFEPFITIMKGLVEDDEEETWYYLLMFTLALTNIRSTSFCIEKCWSKRDATDSPCTAEAQTQDQMYQQLDPDKEGGQGSSPDSPVVDSGQMAHSFLDQMVYIFYLPLFFTGPILTYNLFRKQMNVPVPEDSKSRVASLWLHLLRYIFWALFNEFILHFLYFNSIQHNETVLNSVSQFTLCGLGYLHGQFFMIKYLVMFGLPGTIAKMDYLDPPAGPKCISYIYLYSDMWKYFDRGLYSFLKRYIYVACGGSRSGAWRQITGSLLCFSYISYWHGAEYHILLWILLNYMGVTLEKIGSLITSISFVKHLEVKVLSAGMVQRIHAFCSIPIFLVSCFSMFCFFGGHVVGHLFFKRLILEGWSRSWITLVVLVYCAIQNAIEVNRWLEQRQKQKQT